MDIKRFFADGAPIDGVFKVEGDEFYHMSRVLRYKKGYKAIICNGDNNDYECTVTDIKSDYALARIDNCVKCVGELNFPITLYQAMPKSAKYEYIIQKCVELGANRIVFFDSDYSCKGEWKDGRADKIALEACKQCGRARRVRVERLPSLDAALADCVGATIVMPYEKADGGNMSCVKGQEGALALIIGSEGGFSLKEVERARNSGAKIISLGDRILRCETAAAVATALAVYERGGLGK